jgi:hypothetical protein
MASWQILKLRKTLEEDEELRGQLEEITGQLEMFQGQLVKLKYS